MYDTELAILLDHVRRLITAGRKVHGDDEAVNWLLLETDEAEQSIRRLGLVPVAVASH